MPTLLALSSINQELPQSLEFFSYKFIYINLFTSLRCHFSPEDGEYVSFRNIGFCRPATRHQNPVERHLATFSSDNFQGDFILVRYIYNFKIIQLVLEHVERWF